MAVRVAYVRPDSHYLASSACHWLHWHKSRTDVKRITDHWLNKFDWRAEEKKINELPQFETQITVDGFGAVNMHFLHQKSDVKGAIPFLFVHGWPGSFLEGTKILPLMKGGDGKPAFNVVAPSLPNYGFSSGVFKVRWLSRPIYMVKCLIWFKKGFAISQYAEACHKVMLALGYDQYGTFLPPLPSPLLLPFRWQKYPQTVAQGVSSLPP
jgi:pimeloyl-ACP methyl ester carboxylesterase